MLTAEFVWAPWRPKRRPMIFRPLCSPGCASTRGKQRRAVCSWRLPGEHVDGHDYVAAAFAAGAAMALVERPVLGVTTIGGDAGVPEAWVWPVAVQVPDALQALQQLGAAWRAAYPALRVIGVTGSVGKTVTKEAIAGVLAQRYGVCRNLGNRNNEIGLPLTLLELNADHERAVLEMGMYALGEITLLARLAQPQVGVVTNVGPTHLERLGSIERIAQAKAELVQALPADGLAVLNGDDSRVRAMARVAACPAITFGRDADNDVRAVAVQNRGIDGIVFTVQVRPRADLGLAAATGTLSIGQIGEHNVYVALAAAAVGLAEGLTLDEIAAGLPGAGDALRLAPRAGRNGVILLDDTYNSSPASALAALEALRSVPGRHLAVLGDMLELGAYEAEGHREVGRACAAGADGEAIDGLIAVGERARLMAEAARAAGLAPERARAAEDKDEALDILVDWLRPGDVVLIKGSRGMAMETLVTALEEPEC